MKYLRMRTVGLAAAHVFPLTLFWTGVARRDIIAFCVTYVCVAFAVGAGVHRYFAHRSFRTSRTVQFLLALFSSCFFGDPVEFAAKHRWHHRNSDKEADIHSPLHGGFHCWIGHMLEQRYTTAEMLRNVPDLTRYPELMWIHRFYFIPGLLTAALFLALGGYTMFASAYCLSFLVGIHGPAAVNFFGHRGQRRPFDNGDLSANNAFLGVILFGEGWHNNHHHYPGAARLGFRWYELDLVYWMLKSLAWTGVIWDLHEVPKSVAAVRAQRELAARACALP